MLPHDKLDWNIRRLQERVGSRNDLEDRVALAYACLSRGRFHDGGPGSFHEALSHARRALHRAPDHREARLLSAIALILLDRVEPALPLLDAAEPPSEASPLLHYARAELALLEGDDEAAETSLKACCSHLPDSWEPHFLLGRLLCQRASTRPSVRLAERAQYHLVRALQLGVSSTVEPDAIEDLALLCLRSGRTSDAERLLQRLLDFPRHRARASYHLGRVAARTQRHKRAIWYFRHYLESQADTPVDAWTRIAASYLHLQQAARAREACGKALALDPHDIQARQVLGAALLALQLEDDAVRCFREILEIAPENQDAFATLVRLRTQRRDLGWLRAALRHEVSVYDRLPVQGERQDPRTDQLVPVDPRAATRARIQELIRGLGRVDPQVPHTVLSCLDLTTDEGLRFSLWEGVLDLLAHRRSDQVRTLLAQPGGHYSAEAGRDVLSLAPLLEEDTLIQGLMIEEEDLRRAAVDRHGPSSDVQAYRSRIDQERAEARAWQGLLLLAIASHRSPTARNLLVRWAADADPDLAVAAQAGLMMCGDPNATQQLREAIADRSLGHVLEEASAPATSPDGPRPASLVTDRDDLTCSTCGRRGGQVAHMMHGRGVSVCSVCLSTIHERREELQTRDPDVQCALTGASLLDADALYVYQGVPVASAVVEESMGHDEREAVAAYLAAL